MVDVQPSSGTGRLAAALAARHALAALNAAAACALALAGSLPLQASAADAAPRPLNIALRAEPRTFNPATALDAPSREIVRLLNAELVRIDRKSLRAEAALAESWQVSPDRRTLTVTLRPGLRFSDGAPLTAADVVFTFAVHLDARNGSPAREQLLSAGGEPTVTARDARTVLIQFATTFAPAERVLDSLYILPRHKLQELHDAGRFSSAWGAGADPATLVGSGPFRLRASQPGQRLSLERNPHYWRRDATGQPLPYLDGVEVRFLADAETETLQLRAGQIDLQSRIPARTFRALQTAGNAGDYQFHDAGPGLDYHFLFFNLGDSPRVPEEVRRRQQWFKSVQFRRAVSLAIDREAIGKLVHGGLSTPLWQPVSPANRQWFNSTLPRPQRSLAAARKLLADAGYTRDRDGALLDKLGGAVAFSIAVNAANAQHLQSAAMIQQDLRELGMQVQVAPLEFRSLIERVLTRRDYDAAFMALAPGDADPSSEVNVFLSNGRSHVWDPEPVRIEAWQTELDGLMRAQMAEASDTGRRRLYWRVQELLYEQLPLICIASPHTLTVASRKLEGLQPGVLAPYALSAVDTLRWNSGR